MERFLESEPDPWIVRLIGSQDKAHHRISSQENTSKKTFQWLNREILQNTTKKEKKYTDVIYSSNGMCSLSSGLRDSGLRSNKLFLSLGSNKCVSMTRFSGFVP